MEILDRFLHRIAFRLSRAVGLAAALSIVITLNCVSAGAQEPPIDEYHVKAAFLYNFVKFVQWPPETFHSLNEPISICVLGQDPFGDSLETTVAGRVIDGRSLVVRHIPGVKQAAGCHVLFISASESRRPSPVAAEIKTPGILTICDWEPSGADGVIINFRIDAGKVRFDINVEAADRERIKISSRLLSLARVVESTRR